MEETDHYYEILLCPNGKYHDLLIPKHLRTTIWRNRLILHTIYYAKWKKNIQNKRISGCIAGT